MMKTLKKTTVLFLTAIALISFVLFGVMYTANAETPETDAPKGTATEQLTAEIESLESFKIQGTQVRTVEPWGMRFINVISDSDLEKLPSNAQFGTLIIPEDMLDGDLTLDTEFVANADAKVGYTGTEVPENHKAYTGVIIGTKENPAFFEEDYARGFTAVGYVTYTYDAGEGAVTDTIYTAPVTSKLAQIANDELVALGTTAFNDELVNIVNTVMGGVSVSVDNQALKTGEATDLVVTGMPDCDIALEIVENEYVGYNEETGELYGKKVGTSTVEFKVKATGKTYEVGEIAVSAIEAGKADNVEFLVDDNSVDFSELVANDSVLANALASNGTATVDGTAVSVADNKVTFTKPALDTDAIYGDKARVLTITAGDIEYTVNFSSIVAGYIVDNKAELDNVDTVTKTGDKVWTGYVYLNADIDYEDATFAGIAKIDDITTANYVDLEYTSADYGFRGVFEGNGHYIDNMIIGTAETQYNGFFGMLGNGAVVKNLALVDVQLKYIGSTGYPSIASGVIAVFGAGATISDMFVVAEVKDVTGKNWTPNEGFYYAGRLGVCQGSATVPFTMNNCVLINNINSCNESYWPGASNNIVSSAVGIYSNCMGISYIHGAGDMEGMAFGGSAHQLCPNSVVNGGVSKYPDVSTFNSKYWSAYDYNVDVGSYIGQGFLCMPRVMPVIDQLICSRYAIIPAE